MTKTTAEQAADPTTTKVVTVWEYEYSGSNETYWLPESSEERALEYAGYVTSTGRVRSKTETITTVSSPWVITTVPK